MKLIRDIDVRICLRSKLKLAFADDPGTMMIDEMGLLDGDCRIDLAVVNGQLHGYEIKSDADTLERLPTQAAAYSSVFDRVTIVAGSKHFEKICGHVPEWWGIIAATADENRLILREDRTPLDNNGVDPVAVASLLWRDELLTILKDHGAARGLSGRPRWHLRKVLGGLIPLDELKSMVRSTLKQRIGWRPDAQRT